MTTETRALVPLGWKEQKELAEWAFKSKEFKDIRNAQQAMLLMQYGRELGFGPATALQLVYSVKGIPALKANTIAALLKQVRWRGTDKARYDYKVKERTAKKCVIDFYERNDEGVMEFRGVMEYTMEDAVLAGDTKNPNYKSRPKNMMFARCITEGARVYAPDCLGGLVPYTPDELGDYSHGPDDSAPALPAPGPDGPRGAAGDVLDAEYEVTGEPDAPAYDKGQRVEGLLERIDAKGLNRSNVLYQVGADPNAPFKMTESQFEAIERLLNNL